ncbi:MAG TPA: DUF2846 domain-containing protein [Stellaceae bacterium]|nr:DUF2846 domain-containing protein [Stellaceae bacterium]
MSKVAVGAFLKAGALAMLTLLMACAGGGGPAGPTFAQVAAQLPPAPPDRARIFFYRDYEPYESMGRPYVTLNGDVAGISEPGGVFYRDVPPSRYLIAVRSNTFYPDQDKTVTAAAGQTIYAKVESIRSYNSGDSFYDPDTFAVVLVDPADGQRDIASKRYYPSGS